MRKVPVSDLVMTGDLRQCVNGLCAPHFVSPSRINQVRYQRRKMDEIVSGGPRRRSRKEIYCRREVCVCVRCGEEAIAKVPEGNWMKYNVIVATEKVVL